MYFQNKSVLEVIAESGYNEIRSQIDSEALEKELLRSPPDVIERWQTYSDNKRTTSGWYIRKDDRYEVGFYSNGRNVNVTFFEKWHQAFAHFIKHELEETSAHLNEGNNVETCILTCNCCK
jgi:hypothetical protein